MGIKKQIVWRVYVFFFLCAMLMVGIVAKLIYIQLHEGSHLKEVGEKMQIRVENVDAPRGSIYSDDLRLLSVSVPRYDLYVDMNINSLRKDNGKLFYDSLSLLCNGLSRFRTDRSSNQYKAILMDAYKRKSRYEKIVANLTYDEYVGIKQLPLVRLSPFVGGFMLQEKQIRSYPYGTMAKRTIGLFRENDGSVGIERSYNKWLEGTSGRRMVRKISRGVYAPMDGSEITPKSGKNIVTTINVEMQDVVNTSLLERLQKVDAEWGTCIVMEVETGEIKAIANLKKEGTSNYVEHFNYAVTGIEPGSTMKVVALMNLLEDGYVDLDDMVNISNGNWNYNGLTIKDSEHDKNHSNVSVEDAFAFSSNVGISKLVHKYYQSNPEEFTDHYSRTKMDELVSLHIPGEQAPLVKNPDIKSWSATSLLWMSFGYEVKISPISILTFYNGIANNGQIMQPYIVREIIENNEVLQTTKPSVRVKSMCSKSTLKKVQQSLESVVNYGTAKNLNGSWYGIAGKTGTSLVYNQKDVYATNHYLSSFVGYFPRKKPKYSCIVFIQNKPYAPVYYGAYVAGPVFRKVADYIMANKNPIPVDSLLVRQSKKIFNPDTMIVRNIEENYTENIMPDMRGWKLSDALFFCDNNNISVNQINGKGRIVHQSISAGSMLKKNQYLLNISLQ